MATNNKDYLYDRTALISEYEDYLRGNSLTASIESFTSFLKASKLPTTHSAEIFKYITEENANLQVGDLQIRKSHPVWDYIRKKILIPAGITGGLIGLTTGAIASSGLISGSNFMGFLPVFSNPALTFGATAAIGAGIGAAGTVAFIAGKDAAVRQYYKIRYKDAAANLQQLQDGLDLKNVSMIQLMEKIEATSKEIFTLGKFSPKRAILNKINRNRIHHLEQIIVDLYPMRSKLDGFIAKAKKDNDKSAVQNLLKRKELLQTLLLEADKFISTNIKEGKLNALLTCKEKGKHTHSTVENVDIYATIANKLDAVRKHTNEKDVKKMPNKTTLKKQTAEKLVNGTRRLIPELIERTAVKGGEKEPVVSLPPVKSPVKTPVKVKRVSKSKIVGSGVDVHVTPKSGDVKKTTVKKPVAKTPIKEAVKNPAAKTPIKVTTKKADTKEPVKEPETVTDTKKQSKPSAEKVLIATAVLEKLNDSTFVSTQLNGATALQYTTSKNTSKTFTIDQADIDGLKAKLREWLKSPESSQLRLYGKQDDLFKYIKFRTIHNMRTSVRAL